MKLQCVGDTHGAIGVAINAALEHPTIPTIQLGDFGCRFGCLPPNHRRIFDTENPNESHH